MTLADKLKNHQMTKGERVWFSCKALTISFFSVTFVASFYLNQTDEDPDLFKLIFSSTTYWSVLFLSLGAVLIASCSKKTDLDD